MPYVSGSSALKLSTPPKRVQERLGKANAFRTEGLETKKLDQMVEELFLQCAVDSFPGGSETVSCVYGCWRFYADRTIYQELFG